jgi:hypothetical protein
MHRPESLHFQRQEWEDGISRAKYSGFLSTLSVIEREELYDDVLDHALSGDLSAKCLLVFISFDPHPRLVCKATRNFLQCRISETEDELAGVDELVNVIADNDTTNRGAVLAGLVSFGDRRINAVARAARRPFSGSDVKNFSRVSLPELRSSSVEFCLDWLIELSQNYCKDHVYDIALVLMLIVDQDKHGIVEDLSETEFQQSVKTRTFQVKTFERYYSEIRPILAYLQKCDGFESIIGQVIEVWDRHRAETHVLRIE